ncbi:MAG: hypothetical protein IKN63_02570 [Bacilli bacterium]|nr:hypothetical protein [Bacilli bacterium]
MKGNKKIFVIAVLLLLIAVGYGTYAIYRETQNINGSVRTANWSVQLNGNNFSSTALTFNLSQLTCDSNPGQNGTIAPGAECYIDYVINADGSEVDVVVEAALDTDNSSNIPTNMEVALGDTNGNAGPVTIPYSATSGQMQKTVRLNVVWPGDILDDSTKDGEDLQDKNKNVTIAVKLTARQSLESHS